MLAVELRQVVRYSGATRDAVRARVATELPRAAAAGFQPMRSGTWDARRRRPSLMVEYRWSPPETVEHRVATDWRHANSRLVLDGGEMAFAGYALEDSQFIRSRVNEIGDLVMRYRYDPSTVGEPISPIPSASGDPADTWWAVRRYLQPVTTPDSPTWEQRLKRVRRVALLALGAPRSALDEVHPARR